LWHNNRDWVRASKIAWMHSFFWEEISHGTPVSIVRVVVMTGVYVRSVIHQ